MSLLSTVEKVLTRSLMKSGKKGNAKNPAPPLNDSYVSIVKEAKSEYFSVDSASRDYAPKELRAKKYLLPATALTTPQPAYLTP